MRPFSAQSISSIFKEKPTVKVVRHVWMLHKSFSRVWKDEDRLHPCYLLDPNSVFFFENLNQAEKMIQTLPH